MDTDFDVRDDFWPQYNSALGDLSRLERNGYAARGLQLEIDALLQEAGRPPMDWARFWQNTPIHVPTPRPVIGKPDVRADVWDKTGGKCWYCGVQTNPWRDFAIDHFLARSVGGSDALENLVPCCRSCNMRKGHRTLAWFRQYMSVTAPISFSAEQRAYLEAHGIALPNDPGTYQFYFEKLTGGQS